MSYKLTKTAEIVESIFAIAEGIPLGKEAVKNLFVHNLKKHGIVCKTEWDGFIKNTDSYEPSGLLCYFYEDKTHFYDVFFNFDKPSPDTFVLTGYELNDTLETEEEESASC